MRYLICGVAALALAACEPTVPDSAAGVPDTGRGVGFGDYDEYRAQREAQLRGSGTTATTVRGPVDVLTTPLDSNDTQAAQTSAEADAAARAAQMNSGDAPVEASPSNPAPQIVSNAAGISGENDFSAVSAQRDIQDDAALIARNRAQYQVIQPTDLPDRPGTDRPNIVEYALRTNNPVGSPLYRRSGFNTEAKYQRACASFASADLAQEEFLARGGPERDRLGMDPDGDGFACTWSPAPFRAARNG
ncbi:hypothetical protein [Pseudoponticoccus marisrubri]|uniref:Excalibur calcium-binding domain-containing protein n=1 Tax=Pseudoponticoccus marisrubri TaxID=1685382 RepID=A0A0W7WNB0_9RHOB|nr:hypothetical protein [Pseudoponticoccus marisrubri]KUF12042.1 hypothetical protein AVJ23_05565 [Pseudoponticoccus marisrubri]